MEISKEEGGTAIAPQPHVDLRKCLKRKPFDIFRRSHPVKYFDQLHALIV